MFALLGLSLYLYFLGFELWLRMNAVIPRDLRSIPRERWGAFQGGGKVDQIIRHCVTSNQNKKETRKRFHSSPVFYIIKNLICTCMCVYVCICMYMYVCHSGAFELDS